MQNYTNIYKINSGELTEKDLDLILISLSTLVKSAQKEKSLQKYIESAERLSDKIMRNGL